MKNLQKKLTAWLLMFSLVFCMMPVNVWASEVDFSETTTEAVSEDITDNTSDGTETTSDVETSADDENATVDETDVDDSIVDDSVADDSIVDDSIVDDSVVDDSVVDDSVVDDSVVDDSIVDDSVVDDSVVDEPIIDEPTVDEPIVDEPIVDEPTVDEPMVEEPPVVDEAATPELKPEQQPEQKPDVTLPPMNISTMESPVQATMPQLEVVAPVVPAEVKAFLQAVDELTAGWNDLRAKMESGLDFFAEMEALNSLGVAAMDAYEAVQMADLESFDGVENALFQLMSVTEEMGYAAEMLASQTVSVKVEVYIWEGNKIGSIVSTTRGSWVRPTSAHEPVTSTFKTSGNSSGNITLSDWTWNNVSASSFIAKATSTNNISGSSSNKWRMALPSLTQMYTNPPGTEVKWASSLPASYSSGQNMSEFSSTSAPTGQTIYMLIKAVPAPTYTYTLNYNANGGVDGSIIKNEVTNQTATSYTFTNLNGNPTREGFTLVGWSTTSGENNAGNKVTQVICDTTTKSKTVYAIWEANPEQVTLTYDANGGENPPAAVTQNKGTEFTIAGQEQMKRDDYEFLGWNTDKNATEADFAPGEKITLNANTTLYAVWKKKEPVKPNKTFTLKKVFVNLDEIPSDFSFDYNVKAGANEYSTTLNISNAASKDETLMIVTWNAPYFYNMGESNAVTIVENGDVAGYTYTTKSSSGSVNGHTVTFIIAEMFSGGTRTITNTYTKDIVDNGAGIEITKTRTAINNDTNKNTATVGDTITWKIEVKNLSNVQKTVTLTEMLDDVLLTLDDKPLSDNKLILELGETKTVVATYTVKAEDVGKKLLNTVIGTTDNSEDEPKEDTDEGTKIEKLWVVTYNWTGLPENAEAKLPEINSYIKGVSVMVDKTYTNETEIRVDDKTYVFSGWTTFNPSVEVQNGEFTMPGQDVVISGEWTAKQYNVKYEWTGLPAGHDETLPVGGSYSEGAEVVVDITYSSKSEATIGDKTYVFSGWSIDNGNINGESFLMPGADVTIRGQWSENSITPPTVTEKFNVEYKWSGLPAGHNETLPAGGKYAKNDEVIVNDSYTENTKVIVNGTTYIFSGWSTGDAEITDGKFTMPGQNVTIIGTWTKIETYTVIYTDGVDDEEVFADQTTSGLKLGDKTPDFKGKAIRDGYTFEGWSPKVSETVTGNAIYVAQWKKVDTIPEKPPVNPDPGKPTEPVNPEPGNPSNPTEPSEPSNPENPTTPENPGTPDNSGSGDDSGSDDNTGADDNTGTAEPAPVPVATIDEQATPLTEAPFEEVIFDEEVPLAEMPEEEETLLDDTDVPLANVPKTGDNMLL